MSDVQIVSSNMQFSPPKKDHGSHKFSAFQNFSFVGICTLEMILSLQIYQFD